MLYNGKRVYLNSGYPTISLNGTNVYIHKLIWEQSNGAIPEGYVVIHKDHNKLNYDINNLELMKKCEHFRSRRSNMKGRSMKIRGIKDGSIVEFKSQTDASEILGIKQASISRVINGKQSSTDGWVFEKMSDM